MTKDDAKALVREAIAGDAELSTLILVEGASYGVCVSAEGFVRLLYFTPLGDAGPAMYCVAHKVFDSADPCFAEKVVAWLHEQFAVWLSEAA